MMLHFQQKYSLSFSLPLGEPSLDLLSFVRTPRALPSGRTCFLHYSYGYACGREHDRHGWRKCRTCRSNYSATQKTVFRREAWHRDVPLTEPRTHHLANSCNIRANSLVIALLFSLFNINALAGGELPAVVQIEEAIETEIAPIMSIPGTVISRDDSRLSLEVEGAIKRILEVGDRVEKGDVLVEVDAIRYQLELQEFETSIMPIEAQMSFYEREAKRLQKLAMENNAAKSRLDEVQSNYDESLGKLKIAKTKISQARDKIRRTKILAPFSGVVTERFKTVGEYASPGDDVIRLVNQQNLEIQARAPQYTIPFIQDHKVLAVLDEHREMISQIRTVVPVGDRVSRLYELRLQLNDNTWMAGHSVKVAVPTGPSKKVIAVLHDALVIRRDGLKVYRINGENVAEMVPVTTGIANSRYIEVFGNVKVGDKIVIRGNERLRSGQQVLIQKRTQ